MNDDAERAAGEVAAIIGASPRHPTEAIGRPMIEPKIDELLSQVDLKYTLVTPGRQARLGDQLLLQPAWRGPCGVRSAARRVGARNKPLSIALEEISEGKINAERLEGVGIK